MLDRIIVRGARQHNLRDVDVEIPRDSLTVITGLSGSGKSSLAFDTIYAEGQRRYVETLSPYARQFLDQLERPDVDSIEGLSPALSIEQKTTSRSPRSTMGTATEIYDYLRLLYSSIGTPYCPDCDIPISRQAVDRIVAQVVEQQMGKRVTVLAPSVRGRKGEFKKEFNRLAQLGFLRARVDGQVTYLNDDLRLDRRRNHTIELIIDRLTIRKGIEKRLENSIRTSVKMAGGLVIIAELEGNERLYSETLACTNCGRSAPTIEPRSFSFNSPYGACEMCNGLGNIWNFDPAKVILDPAKPLLTGGAASALLSPRIERAVGTVAKRHRIALEKPFEDLSERHQSTLLWGNSDKLSFGKKNLFPGLIGLLAEGREEYKSESYRDWQAQFLSPTLCGDCKGRRLRPESLAVRVGGKSISEICALPITRALEFVQNISFNTREKQIAARIIAELRTRLRFLISVGLDYLSLDRSAATLSGGEAQRVRLATQIGSQLRGVLYVLDEPSVGLHARDNEQLLDTLSKLRDIGNTVIVVEHDQETIERADYVVDLGPAAGRLGGEVVAMGPPKVVARSTKSLTGDYLSGRKKVFSPKSRRSPEGKAVVIRGACQHNLRDITVEFPLGMLIVVTGVSGSGKSTLVNGILYPALAKRIYRSRHEPGWHVGIDGADHVDKVVRIDQAPIGRTPRSNPATYTGLFTPIRSLYAMLRESRARGYKPGRFSFNVKGGRCEACHGGGQRRIEMNFLPDVFVTCELCRGSRYNQETLQVTYKGVSIADLLETTVEDALPLMQNLPQIALKLETLCDVGLGYLRLGQPSPTLSGGEAQRIKLARELSKRQTGRTLYLLDEPTTGLHFDDVRKLLEVLHQLVSHGNTVIIVEHNLDIVKSADWIVDLGPEGGEGGGQVVVAGPPEKVADCKRSYTGQALARMFRRDYGTSE